MLSNIFASLLIEKNFNSLREDFNQCTNERDIQQCSAVELKTKSFQCCKLKSNYTFQNKTEEKQFCNVMLNPIKIALDEQETQNGKLMIREYLGFTYLRSGTKRENFTYVDEITCQDGNYSLIMDDRDYSEEEKTIYNSENYCLKYFDRHYSGENITKETCFNSLLATPENSGISCGFFEFKLNFYDSTNGNYKTCFLFNEDIIKNKNIGFFTKYLATKFSIDLAKNQNKELLNYQLTITDSKGRNFIYDFSEPSNADIYLSKFISFKFLYILLLILI